MDWKELQFNFLKQKRDVADFVRKRYKRGGLSFNIIPIGQHPASDPGICGSYGAVFGARMPARE